MNPNREEFLLYVALTKSDGERRNWLHRECAEDSALRQRVETLLAAHEQAATELEPSAIRWDDYHESSTKDQDRAELGPAAARVPPETA